MTYTEIIERLKELEINIHEFANEEIDPPADMQWTEVAAYGGEGQGETWFSVKHFPGHGIYIKVSGYYQSYDGVSFHGGYKECCQEVKPVEKTVLVYE